MLFSSLAKVVALVAFSSQVALAAPTTTSPSPAVVQQQALAAHNKYRSKHHVVSLKWNPSLAAHASGLAKTCKFGHSKMAGTGQNIARGYPSMTAAIDAWYNEVANYNYATGSSKNGGVTGHFTQVVWKGTTEVGCGAIYCPGLKGVYYVCDYKGPGNYLNQYVANVLRP